jgi:molecular chaperone DnaJ
MSDDYYDLLGVERGADDAALKSAYRKAAMQHHPDRNPGDAAAESKFKAVNEAYDILKDPQKRAAYDRYGKAAFENGGASAGAQDFGGFSDIFENIFGEFMGGGGRGGGRPRGPQRGADLRYDMDITLEEAFHGKKTEVRVTVAAACEPCDGSGAKPGTSAKTCSACGGRGQVRAQQGFFVVERPCPTCRGAGKTIDEPCASCRGAGRVDKEKTLSVSVPPGVDDGTRIRLSGEGEAGERGAQAGDLYIFLHVKRHSVFERDGTTLFARIPVSFTVAALGGTITVPGLDRVGHEMRIPAGIQSGKQLRQRGAGMPVLNGRTNGDLVVQIDVETPTKLTAKQKDLLEQFRATETGEECPQSTSVFDKLRGMWDDLTG